jgi:FAD synthetase
MLQTLKIESLKIMNKILNIKKAITISNKLRDQDKKIVLVGGCFDILHIGHITFLEKAKQQGDVLFVLLEPDDKIKKIKGVDRPVNSQADRAKILSSLTVIDYILTLPPNMTDDVYDKLVFSLKPAIIATTTGDPNRFQKERSAKLINGKVVDVIKIISDKSTTKLIKILKDLE